MRNRSIQQLSTGVALAASLWATSAFAAVSPYSWIRGGESGIMADSSGKNHPFNAAFSSGAPPAGGGLTAAITTPVAVGGPLSGTGAISTVSTRWGSYPGVGNSGMWIQGPNNTVPPPAQWSLPAVNWIMECWVLPVGTGGILDRSTSQFMSTGSGQFGGTPGGAAFRTADNGDGTISITANSLGAGGHVIGDPLIVDKSRWVHVAVVNDNGVTTFYADGVAHGPTSADVSAPSGVPYIGSGQDTGAAFQGYLDELRYSTFEPGQFVVADLLLLPPGPGFVSKPQSISVWNGGAAPFEVVTTFNTSTTYQWKRGGVNIVGATGAEFVLPTVSPADNDSVFAVVVTSNGQDATTPNATLTVVPTQTDNNAFYRAAIQAEASLAGYFPVDGDSGATLTNVKDATHNGGLQGAAAYDGRLPRSYGERAVRLNGTGEVTIPANPAFEFSDGSGTIEVLAFLGTPVSASPKTLFALANDPASVYYALQVSADGTSLVYYNDAFTPGASWSVPTPLLQRFAHIAVVFNAGKVTAFVDGVSLGTKDNPGFGATTGLTARIGSVGTDAEGLLVAGWNGTLDELAIYGDALSDNAIAIHNSRFIYGTAVTAPTIETAPTGVWNLLAGGAPIFRVKAVGTAPLAYQWKLNGNAITGNPTATTAALTLVNSTVASSGEYTVTVSNPIGDVTSAPFTVNFTAPSASDKYAQYVLADQPTAYWRLNETTGTTLKDYAGGLDGTYSSTVDRGVPGPYGIDPDLAAHFSGSASPVANAIVPFTPSLNPTGPFTIEFWAKPDQSGQNSRAVIGNQNRNTGRAGYAVYQGFNGNFWEAHIGVGESVNFIQGTVQPVAGRWDHVVVTWDGNTVARIYVNGVDDTNPGSTVAGPHRANLSVPLEIGSRFGNGIPYPGTIDEVAFYNRQLTPAQIQKHFSIAYFASAVVTQPPAVVNSTEPDTITLAPGVVGFPNTYQWLRNGTALDPDAVNFDGSLRYPRGVTGPTLAITLPTPADNGNYRLVINNPLGNSQTELALVTVAPDTTPPTVAMVNAQATPTRVRVVYSRPVTPETAGVAGNYTFSGGITANAVVLTTDSRIVDVVTSAPLTPNTKYTLSVSGVRDQRSLHNLIGANSTPFTSYVLTPGVLAWDYYGGITGSSVDDNLRADAQFPDGVLTNSVLTQFSTMAITIGGNLNNNPDFGPRGDNYGAHVYGWITPTESANYTFFLRSDDASQLWLSGDSNPAGATQIAFEPGCCAAFVEPDNDRTSAPIALVANQSYYIEAFYKEGGGGDYVEVAWRKEGDTTPAATLKPIPGNFLSALAAVPAPKFNAPTLAGGKVTLTWTGTGVLEESSNLETWTPVPGNPPSGFSVTPIDGATRLYRLR